MCLLREEGVFGRRLSFCFYYYIEFWALSSYERLIDRVGSLCFVYMLSWWVKDGGMCVSV